MFMYDQRSVDWLPYSFLRNRLPLIIAHTQFEAHYYHACTDGLPFGLTYQSTRAEVRKLFGPPACEDGPIEEIFPPQNIIYWDRWDYANHFVHVTYSEQCDSVLRIILESIPTPPSNKTVH
jgi:hypothetical protein